MADTIAGQQKANAVSSNDAEIVLGMKPASKTCLNISSPLFAQPPSVENAERALVPVASVATVVQVDWKCRKRQKKLNVRDIAISRLTRFDSDGKL